MKDTRHVLSSCDINRKCGTHILSNYTTLLKLNAILVSFYNVLQVLYLCIIIISIIYLYSLGGELFEYILAHRYLKEKDASRLFAQLISGVHYMHQKHIVHRDLKLVSM